MSFIFLLSPLAFSEQTCEESVGEEPVTDFSNNLLVQRLNRRLNNPEYKVLLLARHGKASGKNKFSAAERQAAPNKVALDIQRPLKKKGLKGVKRLANLMSYLSFSEVGMWGSHANRVRNSARPTIEVLKVGVLKVAKFIEKLYYADVPHEMQKHLCSEEHDKLAAAFFWGHGKTTLKLFKSLTATKEGFLPTAAVMIVALKADTWTQVFNGDSDQIEAYAWSPNKSHQASGGDVPVASLESTVGLEKINVAVPDNQGFELTVIR